MMKISADTLGDLACEIVFDAADNGFGAKNVELDAVEKVELATHFKRALAEGKKRVVFDVIYSTRKST